MISYLDQVLSSWDHLDAFMKGVVYGCGSTISGALLGYAGRKIPLRGVEALLGLFAGPWSRDHSFERGVYKDLRAGRCYLTRDHNQLIRGGEWMVTFGRAGDPDGLCIWDNDINSWIPITHRLSPRKWRGVAKAAARRRRRYQRDPLMALMSASPVEYEKPKAWGAPTPEVKQLSCEEMTRNLQRAGFGGRRD